MDEPFMIEERTFPEMTVLSVRTRDDFKAMGTHIRALYGQARLRNLAPSGPLFTVYFEKPEGNNPVDYELCLPVEGRPEELDKLADFGGEKCLYLRVKGSYGQFGAAYKAFEDELYRRGIQPIAPPREVYVRGPLLGFLTFIPVMVTDIYFPIGEK